MTAFCAISLITPCVIHWRLKAPRHCLRLRNLQSLRTLRMSLPPAILLTNDDGLDPSHALVLPLAQQLASHGHSVVVVAPAHDNSACGQKITLGRELSLVRHGALEARFSPSAGSLAVFSLSDGSPADCVIVATEPTTGLLARMGMQAALCVSGVNMGNNLGNDVLYSGTFGAARQAAMYGVPAVAASVDLFRREPGSEEDEGSVRRGILAATEVALGALEALRGAEVDAGRLAIGRGAKEGDVRAAFVRGDVVLNVNVPQSWGGRFVTTRLDCVLHRAPVDVERVPRDGEEVRLKVGFRDGYVCEFLGAKGSDSVAVREGGWASVTPVSTWPSPHPLAVAPAVLEETVGDGLMKWLVLKEKVPF